jgi:hypothetical protein
LHTWLVTCDRSAPGLERSKILTILFNDSIVSSLRSRDSILRSYNRRFLQDELSGIAAEAGSGDLGSFSVVVDDARHQRRVVVIGVFFKVNKAVIITRVGDFFTDRSMLVVVF